MPPSSPSRHSGVSRSRSLASRLKAFSLHKTRYLIVLFVTVLFYLLWMKPHLPLMTYEVATNEPVSDEISPSLAGDLTYLDTVLHEHFSSHGQTVPHPVFPHPVLTTSQRKRYRHIAERLSSSPDKIMFTTIIRQIQDQLPDLLASIVVLVDFLGPTSLTFSFIEGPSSDLTSSTFESVLHPLLITLGVPAQQIRFITSSPPIDFDAGNRIALLADLRNQALAPLWEDRERKSGGIGDGVKQVVFFNDVYMKAEFILELLQQHRSNRADVTTAWDWYRREPKYYYDVWVGRTIDTGDLFYPMPHTWWSPNDDLFPDSPSTRAAFDHLEPFQVFATWNGIAVLSATPFLPPHNVRFRRGNPTENECSASECLLVCSDFWKSGAGKIQVVPSVQVAYERDVAAKTETLLQKAKKELGWVDGVPSLRRGQSEEQAMQWKAKPPRKVRCNPWPDQNGLSANVWEHTTWLPPWPGYMTG